MMLKIVTFFLIGILVLGMFGKLRVKMIKPPKNPFALAKRCPECGIKIPKDSTCPCKAS